MVVNNVNLRLMMCTGGLSRWPNDGQLLLNDGSTVANDSLFPITKWLITMVNSGETQLKVNEQIG